MKSGSLKEAFTAVAVGGAAAAAVLAAPVTFGMPWMLAGLASLPALWWLMRSVPPKPKKEPFPAIRLLFNLKSEDQEPARMPLWQRLLRLSAAALIVAGLAQPEFNPDETVKGDGPVMLVVDNDWASARNWESRVEQMNDVLERAEKDRRSVIILSTTPPADGSPIRASGPVDAAEARKIILELEPRPWPSDRKAAAEAVERLSLSEAASIIWLSNGLEDEGAFDLTEQLKERGTLKILEDAPEASPRLLVPPVPGADALTITVRRPNASADDIVSLTASDEAGRPVSQKVVRFKAGETEVRATFDLPPEVRNQLTRVAIDGDNSAGAVVLLDERWRRRPVGLVDVNGSEPSHHLLDEASYIKRSLDPYVTLREGSITDLLERELAVMVLTDAAAIDQTAERRLDAWVQQGGTLLRFAGPRLAAGQATGNDLLPVPLRQGGRTLGGRMSGTGEGRLAPFEERSPFYGIALPGDVTVKRGVLAEPGFEVEERTWARLQDGTPLVTARQHGQGWIVLVHTTANAEWSNLPLSGLFVDMMRAIVAHSQGITGGPGVSGVALPPIKTLDGQGQLATPSPVVRPLTKEVFEAGEVSPRHPPGFYGNESIRQAHNLAAAVSELKPLGQLPEGVSLGTYAEAGKENDLSGPVLAGALALVIADLLILLGQQGHLPRPGGGGQTPARGAVARGPRREPG